MDVIHEMQAWKLVPEAFLVEPGCDLPGVVQDALAQGIRMFVVCGGDGTILCRGQKPGWHQRATLGIIPIGTQNNMALSLGIPSDIPAAIAILRTGRRIKVDVGMATCGKDRAHLPPGSLLGGAGFDLFPSADDIQHGNLARIGDFLATLVASPPAEIHLVLDNKQEIHTLGHVVLVSNMPYIGLHYQVGAAAAFNDGLLDVLFFADLSKLDLLGYVVQEVVGGGIGRPTHPALPRAQGGYRHPSGHAGHGGWDWSGRRAAAHHCTTARPGGDGRQVGVRGCARPRRDSEAQTHAAAG